jgi:hypothetical protein
VRRIIREERSTEQKLELAILALEQILDNLQDLNTPIDAAEATAKATLAVLKGTQKR